MNIPPLRKGGRNKVVLWDMATECNYVRIAHAEKMGFSYKMERLVIQTVGGEVPEGICPVYTCKIMGCHTWGDYKRTVLSANKGTAGWPIPSEQWSGESDSQIEASWHPVNIVLYNYKVGYKFLLCMKDINTKYIDLLAKVGSLKSSMLAPTLPVHNEHCFRFNISVNF